MMSPYPNRNTLWANVFVDELARSGLEAVCIAPGSRSTPLTLAFAQHDRIKVFSHLDERSAAFFALGHAIGTKKPAALVCTSGTAAANWFPAVIEAYQFEVPLLLLTSDRPHELRHSGANQTIDQVKLYGDYALWAVDMALPEADSPDIAIRNLRTTANRAFATANGLRQGPVHINFPFRKPLEPTEVQADTKTIVASAEARPDEAPFTAWQIAKPQASNDVIEQLAGLIEGNERGIIVCGPQSPGEEFPAAVAMLSKQTGYPIFADPLSGVRFDSLSGEQVISTYETTLAGSANPFGNADVVFRFGRVPTSKWLNNYLRTCGALAHIHVRANGVWSDDMHITSHFIQADEASLCDALVERLPSRPDSNWRQRIFQVDEQAKTHIETITQAFSDAAVTRILLEEAPEDTVILAGNSLPVRHIDQFGTSIDKQLLVHANRGASGIDGNTSTALGLGAAFPDKPLVLLCGDITLYHDMNGLLAVKRLGIPITIVVINNNGGGIFHRLPIRNYEPEFTEQFLTPHNLTFEHTAKLYDLDYIAIIDLEAFRLAFTDSITQQKSTIIEVFTNALADEEQRQVLVKSTQAEFKEQNQ